VLAWDHNLRYHPLLLEQLPARMERVLEVGCGAGQLSCALAARAERVDALDRDPAMVSAARARVPGNVSVVLADVEQIPLPSTSYDAVVSVAVLHHLDLARALPRFADTLRPGGILAAVGLPRRDLGRELPVELAAAAVHHGCGLLRLARRQPVGATFLRSPAHAAMPIADPDLTTREVRAVAGRLLPGASVRRLVLWRYLLVWRKPPGLTRRTRGEDTGDSLPSAARSTVTEQRRGVGIPAAELEDDDLERELTHAHEKRHDIFVDGTADQLANHSSRTHELEAEYLRRFADRVKDASAKAQNY
jgi:SAM-dependent methyltransferase